MLFNSSVFLYAFLPLSVLGFYLLARHASIGAAKVWLCVASFAFYGWWHPAFLVLLVGSIAFNYTLSLFLGGPDKSPGRGQTLLLAAGVTANVLLLAYFKYLFPLLRFLHELGWLRVDAGSVILPLGISFFTFTQIGYLVDCRQGQVRQRGLVNYVLFVTFFPHLIAGPILHNREIMPQFASPDTYRFKAQNLAVGLALFAFGLFKKVVIADSMAPWANAGFLHTHGAPFEHAWSVALAYSMQLYFDFSGYADMAIALGIMFGVKLPLNFNSPYKSASIIDFWQRWHMTLTRYLTLLLYNPLAFWIARRRKARGLSTGRDAVSTPSGFLSMIGFPTMVTILIAGVWHGAGMQFVIFGALHGSYLCVNHLWRILRPLDAAGQAAAAPLAVRLWRNVWRVALTYLAVLVAEVFFRAGSVNDALGLLSGMMGVNGAAWAVPSRWQFIELLLGLSVVLIAFCAPNVYQIMDQWSPALTKVRSTLRGMQLWQPNFRWALIGGTLLFAASLRLDQSAPFLYFQF
jgi:D-alanyl-lipoteichoic acid acyltransferase DltB (MBOAT superfamily)